MVVCCGIVGRGACIQSLLVSVLLLVLVFPFLSSREFSGLTPQRAEPLYHSLNPLFCDVFAAAVVVCARSQVKSRCRLISVLFASIFVINLQVIEIFQANNYRLPHWKKTVPIAQGNFRKFAPEFLVEW